MKSKPSSSASRLRGSSQSSTIDTAEVTYKGWRALEVRSGDLRLVFAPEIGGRVVGCSFKDRELLRTHPETEGAVVPSPATLEELKRTKVAGGFRFYGGSKTWLSPQEEWPEALPFFDLDAGAYECLVKASPEGVRVRMKSPVCRESGMQIEREFAFRSGEPKVRFLHRMTNRSASERSHGLWDVTELVRPGWVYMPLRKDSKFPGGVKVFETENKNRASVLAHVKSGEGSAGPDTGGFAAIRCDDNVMFKVGTDSEEGWLLGFFPAVIASPVCLPDDVRSPRGRRPVQRWIVFRKTFEVLPGRPGGHGCSVEVFNSDARPNLEMEAHSALVRLKPGESFSWKGEWSFAEADRLPETRRGLDRFLGSDPFRSAPKGV